MNGKTAGRSLGLSLWIVLAVAFLPGCIFHRHREPSTQLNPGDQPDKILYERATAEIRRGRYDVGRLTLQTLINTYPDSEYLAKAKLAIADSYYNEGSVSGLTQADAEYKDFITFFPTAPEAPEAQFRVGMAHYRMMAKADRDRVEARLAEVEFKEFLLKYPDNRLKSRVKNRLRQVQEVLAQGDYKIAQYYYQRGVWPASRSRYQEIVDRYPNFSQSDNALWYLGQSLERMKKANEAIPYYARILTDHPLGEYVEEAKERLTAMKQPIPRPTKAMRARAEADATHKPGRDIFSRLGGMLSSRPDTSTTRHGPVRLGAPPPSEAQVATTGTAPASATTSVVAQPVSDASLSAGQPVDTKPAASGASGATASSDKNAASGSPTGTEKAASSTPEKSSATSEAPAPKKKKGRLHIFKRIIKPF